MMVSYMIVGLALWAVQTADAELPFKSYVLNAPMPVCDVATEDLQGAGKRAILALCCDEKTDPLKKTVAVYLPGSDGGYAASPTLELPLSSDIGCLFFTRLEKDATRVLAAANADGVTLFRFTNNQFEQIDAPRFSSLYPNGVKSPVFISDFSQDLNGDGVDEWLVPQPSGYEIRTPSQVLAKIKCDVNSSIMNLNNLTIYHKLPVFASFPLPDQSTKGIAFFR